MTEHVSNIYLSSIIKGIIGGQARKETDFATIDKVLMALTRNTYLCLSG